MLLSCLMNIYQRGMSSNPFEVQIRQTSPGRNSLVRINFFFSDLSMPGYPYITSQYLMVSIYTQGYFYEMAQRSFVLLTIPRYL